MKKILNLFAILLLLFNGIGALYGGGNLIIHPDGSTIQLTLHWLHDTPFKNYLIPGIVLFIANGLFSFFALGMLFFNRPVYPWLVLAQGAILSGWIIIQIWLIQTTYFLHAILGGTGLALIIIGIMLIRINKKIRQQLT